ncbi:MAG: hypothetical protein ACJZ78_02335 [Prochlorococcus marinus]
MRKSHTFSSLSSEQIDSLVATYFFNGRKPLSSY